MMIRKFFKYGLLVFLFILIISFVVIFVMIIHTGPRMAYLEEKFLVQNRDFIVDAFKKVPVRPPEPGHIALVVGADIASEDLRLPLGKGYDVIAYDGHDVRYEIMPSAYGENEKRLQIEAYWSFTDFEKLPPLDLVMAGFFFPFYEPWGFKRVWAILDQKIKPGGYFIGNFFDPRFSVFEEDLKKKMTFHTKQEVLKLLSQYKILSFVEVNDGPEHYYEVFAQKI